jgi:hypothetical protein
MRKKWYQLCEILESQVMKVRHFSMANLNIPQSHNGLQCEIFDIRCKGGLKLHPKHVKNHDRFLKVAIL